MCPKYNSTSQEIQENFLLWKKLHHCICSLKWQHLCCHEHSSIRIAAITAGLYPSYVSKKSPTKRTDHCNINIWGERMPHHLRTQTPVPVTADGSFQDHRQQRFENFFETVFTLSPGQVEELGLLNCSQQAQSPLPLSRCFNSSQTRFFYTIRRERGKGQSTKIIYKETDNNVLFSLFKWAE